MTEALAVSNVLLWIVVVALAVVVLALLRQIGVLHERVAPAGALVGREAPRVGEGSSIVDAEDWSGRTIRIGGANDRIGSTLIFFVSPTCPVCKTLIGVVRRLPHSEGRDLAVIFASDGPRSEHEAFVLEHALDRETYVLSRELGLAYQVGRLPYAVLLGSDGVVRGRGLVNSREHLESLLAAEELGVASVQEFIRREKGEERVA